MKQLVTIFIVAMTLLIACGPKKEDSAALAEKKTKLESLKKEQASVNESIAKLEAEIAKLDPASAKAEKTKLVTLATISPEQFNHYIDLQGKVESENISFVTPRGAGGQVKALFVKRGDVIKKGQLLLKLDDAIAKQSLITTQQSLETIKTQLAFARNIYNKQKNLWDQNIGTEVQLITAKNNVETLETQLKTAEEQVKLSKEQLSFCEVRAELDGVADDVNLRVGELFMGAGQIKIVNTSNLKVTTQIPENYLSKVRVGTPIKINLPDINKTIESRLSVAGKLIDANSRSFFVEAKIEGDKDLHPNQVALVRIQDYQAANAIVVPVNTLQNDEKGKYIMVAVKEGNKLVAHKKPVVIGNLYADKLEIKSGINSGDQVVTEGYQSLYEGQSLTTETK